MPEAIEITRLRAAIDQFKARQPRDLPDGVMEALERTEKELSRVEPGNDSPGAREAAKASTGTGVPFQHAAKGPDKASPGQREAAGLSAEMMKAAQAIHDASRK